MRRARTPDAPPGAGIEPDSQRNPDPQYGIASQADRVTAIRLVGLLPGLAGYFRSDIFLVMVVLPTRSRQK